ncbi:MAG: STAS domain-containing protein [Planctomycetes bacterium]|nr:STAS domain-containing protein [Planctomycetota bacterium]
MLKPRPMRGRAVFHAFPDMTEYDRIRELVHWTDDRLERGASLLTLDLSRVTAMDSSLVAGIILACRRAKAHRAVVRIKKFPEQFAAMLEVYRVREMLIEAGVEFVEPRTPADVKERTADTPEAEVTTKTASHSSSVAPA